jgi:hypothetical protein
MYIHTHTLAVCVLDPDPNDSLCNPPRKGKGRTGKEASVKEYIKEGRKVGR